VQGGLHLSDWPQPLRDREMANRCDRLVNNIDPLSESLRMRVCPQLTTVMANGGIQSRRWLAMLRQAEQKGLGACGLLHLHNQVGAA